MDAEAKPTTGENEQERSSPFPEWAETAYRLWARGQRNWTELGKQFGVHRTTAQSNVMKFARASQAAREAEGAADAYMEALTAYEEIRSVAWQDHAACGKNWNARKGFLNVAADMSEKIAVLRGVVTQRVAIVDETPKPLDDQPLELLVRIVKNGDGHAEEDG